MGCMSVKQKQEEFRINITEAKRQLGEAQNSSGIKDCVSLFTIKEESANFEESAFPSRAQSNHPNNIMV